MSFIKRAVLYAARKWQQSLIAFLILLAVCTSALMGLSILKATDTAAANLRGTVRRDVQPGDRHEQSGKYEQRGFYRPIHRELLQW